MKDAKIIVALDYDNLPQAKSLVDQLNPELCKVKVGKQMFTLFGPDWVEYLTDKGFEVFLDLKFHDIPNTVAKACLAAARLKVWMVNVHAIGGEQMLRAAVDALRNFSDKPPLLTAVTILTSIDQLQYQQLGYQRSLQQQICYLASMAKNAGLDGVVCSAKEAQALRNDLGDNFKLVTPGIRLQNDSEDTANSADAADDQRRVMTPVQAINAGANYLVIGRPITQSADPLKTLCEISESLAIS